MHCNRQPRYATFFSDQPHSLISIPFPLSCGNVSRNILGFCSRVLMTAGITGEVEVITAFVKACQVDLRCDDLETTMLLKQFITAAINGAVLETLFNIFASIMTKLLCSKTSVESPLLSQHSNSYFGEGGCGLVTDKSDPKNLGGRITQTAFIATAATLINSAIWFSPDAIEIIIIGFIALVLGAVSETVILLLISLVVAVGTKCHKAPAWSEVSGTTTPSEANGAALFYGTSKDTDLNHNNEENSDDSVDVGVDAADLDALKNGHPASPVTV